MVDNGTRKFFEKLNHENFFWRLISSLVLAPIVLVSIYIGGWIYNAFAVFFIILGIQEWLRIVDPSATGLLRSAVFLGGFLVLFSGVFKTIAFATGLGVFFLIVIFLIALKENSEKALWVALAIPYLGGGGLAFIDVRNNFENGVFLAFYLILTVWATDIGAYLVGKVVGGAKLIPSVSPKKTWAGFVGGLLFAIVLGSVFARAFNITGITKAVLLSFALSLITQAGDLFESYVKRCFGVKDSGNIIPGHGGVLDRIDGLIFAAIFFSLFLNFFGEILG